MTKTLKSVSLKRAGSVVLALALLSIGGTVLAANITNIGSVDAIDFNFAPGGGVFNGPILNGSDASWMTFNATLGDILNIVFTKPGADIGDQPNFVGGAFFDAGDGLIQVGDIMNIPDWNIDVSGTGSPLQVITGFSTLVSGGCFNPNGFCATLPLTHQFVALFTGQYGIVVATTNQTLATSAFQVTLTGNTAVSVPEPTTLILLGAGLIGFGFMRRKRAA